jgi:2-methylcitrate dehydratase PrpD
MGRPIETLAQFIATTQLCDIPQPVRDHAKLVLLDTVGVILAGSERPEVVELRERLAQGGGAGASVWARGWRAQDPRTAALLNGTAGRAIELCEGLRLVSGQAAIQVLPGVLALAESRRASGCDLLAAFVLEERPVRAVRRRPAARAAPVAHRRVVPLGAAREARAAWSSKSFARRKPRPRLRPSPTSRRTTA